MEEVGGHLTLINETTDWKDPRNLTRRPPGFQEKKSSPLVEDVQNIQEREVRSSSCGLLHKSPKKRPSGQYHQIFRGEGLQDFQKKTFWSKVLQNLEEKTTRSSRKRPLGLLEAAGQISKKRPPGEDQDVSQRTSSRRTPASLLGEDRMSKEKPLVFWEKISRSFRIRPPGLLGKDQQVFQKKLVKSQKKTSRRSLGCLLKDVFQEKNCKSSRRRQPRLSGEDILV